MSRLKAVAVPRMLVAAAFAAFVAFAGVFVLPPLDRDESRFAQATAQMLESGDFVTIRFQEAERNKKPAGVYWLQAASVATFSSAEAREIWAYRLPSALAIVLAACLVFVAGRRLFDAETGLLAALLFASAPLVAGEATIAKTDAVLTLTVALAGAALIHIAAAHREGARPGRLWPLTFWTALAAGVLVKGPIAPMILLLTVAALVWRKGDRKGLLLALRPVSGLLLAAALVAPWFLAVERATEGRFLVEAFGRDLAGKIGAAQESHGGPPGFHTALTPLLFWPAVALLPSALLGAWRARLGDWRVGLLLAWLAPSWIVFELASTKLPHYVLPLYPALALLAAHGAVSGAAAPRADRVGAALYLLAGLALAAALVALPFVYGSSRLAVVPLAAALLVAAATARIARLFWRGARRRAAWRAAILSALFVWTTFQAVAPRLSALDVSRNLSRAFAAAGAHPLKNGAPPVALAGYAEPSAVFLLGTRTQLGDGADAARHLATVPGSAVAVEAAEEDSFRWGAAQLGVRPRPLAATTGVNYSKGDPVRITIYAADRTPPRP